MRKQLFLTSIFLSSCGSKMYDPPAPHSDVAFDHVLIHPDLRPDFMAFLGHCSRFPEAKKKCKKLLPELISVQLATTDLSPEKEDRVVGTCTRYPNKKRVILIDPDFWKTGSCASRALMFHELGHCLLDSGHAKRSDYKIMSAHVLPESFCNDSWPTLVEDFFSTQYARDK